MYVPAMTVLFSEGGFEFPIGLYILDAIKGTRVGTKSPMIPDEQSSDYGPRLTKPIPNMLLKELV